MTARPDVTAALAAAYAARPRKRKPTPLADLAEFLRALPASGNERPMIEGWIAEIERAQGLTEAQAFARVQAAVRAAGSQKELADGMGISREYLSDMLNNRRPISDGLLRAAGLRRVVTYVDDGGTR